MNFNESMYAACIDSAYMFTLSITVIFHVDMRYSVQSVEETGRSRQEPKIQASTWCQERMYSKAVVQDVGMQEDVFCYQMG